MGPTLTRKTLTHRLHHSCDSDPHDNRRNRQSGTLQATSTTVIGSSETNHVFQGASQHFSVFGPRRCLVGAGQGAALPREIAGAYPGAAAKVVAVVVLFDAKRQARVHEFAAKVGKLPFGTFLRQGRARGDGRRERRPRRHFDAGRGVVVFVQRDGASAIGVAADDAGGACFFSKLARDAVSQRQDGAGDGGGPRGALAIDLRLLAFSKRMGVEIVATKDAAGAAVGTGEFADAVYGAIDVVVLKGGANHGVVVRVEWVLSFLLCFGNGSQLQGRCQE